MLNETLHRFTETTEACPNVLATRVCHEIDAVHAIMKLEPPNIVLFHKIAVAFGG